MSAMSELTDCWNLESRGFAADRMVCARNRLLWNMAFCGGGLRKVARFVACAGLALSVAACDVGDAQYFRRGIGTDLASPDIATTTELQDIYLDYLCRQTLSFVGATVPDCQSEVSPNVWPQIVQAGMNDIDQRCDSYLAWLDQMKRENAAILTEIAAVRVAVDALTNPVVSSGVGPRTLAAVAAAFGLASSTFNNVNSLLLQVDHTTVQSVVFGRRQDFRLDVGKHTISSKPIAVHALRMYLTICMPMTIAADINSTVTVFQQAGAGAIDRGRVSADPRTLGRPMTANEQVRKPDRPIKEVKTFSQIIKNYTAKEFPKDVVVTMLNVLCVPMDEVDNIDKSIGETTKSHIAIFEETDLPSSDKRLITRDGMLDAAERDLLIRNDDCPRSMVKNFYERTLFKDGQVTDVSWLIKLLDRVQLPGIADLPEATTLNEARIRIGMVRRSLAGDPANGKKFVKRPASMDEQWTRDLFQVLSALPKRT
jgi:hypothetical protein